MEGIYFEITVIISLAALLTILFRFLKLPSILAYILTGVLLGPLGLLDVKNHTDLQLLGQVGITLLLFLLGLELKLHELRSIGKTAIIAGGLQVILTFLLGFVASLLLGFSQVSSLYLGIGLAFSSTIIIVKILSDKKDLTSIHGKLAVGILLMQDFFAIMTIIFLSGTQSSGGGEFLLQTGIVLLKVVVLFGWIIILSKYFFPRIVHSLARTPETLFLFSLGWVFVLTAIVTSPLVGFSLEIGGFLAGLALANSAENFQIVARMKSLRDFFITIFFVILGLEMTFDNVGAIILPALVLILFVIFIKPLIVMGITGVLGYRKRTSFLTGVSLSQVSEFSLIILFLGSEKGVIPSEVTTLVVLVALVTFATSTFFLTNVNQLYNRMKHLLDFIELRKHHVPTGEIDPLESMKHHVVVIGAHQLGRSIIRALENSGEELVVVDFNPDVITELQKLSIPHLFGDIADPDIQERVGISRARIIISTIPDIDDNQTLIRSVKHMNPKAKIIVMALETDDARVLYKEGADYVVLPHLAGGRHLAKIIVDNKHMELIEDYKARDLAAL